LVDWWNVRAHVCVYARLSSLSREHQENSLSDSSYRRLIPMVYFRIEDWKCENPFILPKRSPSALQSIHPSNLVNYRFRFILRFVFFHFYRAIDGIDALSGLHPSSSAFILRLISLLYCSSITNVNGVYRESFFYRRHDIDVNQTHDKSDRKIS
jgi:hypothetical protein